MVPVLSNLSYEHRLRHLNLYCQREHADLITIYKLLKYEG